MNAPAAIRGTFSDFRLVKGRKVAQLVIELPIEQADQALSVLGGLPRSDAERWVALARLKETAGSVPAQDEEASPLGVPEGSRPAASSSAPRKPWADLPPSQQAAIRCAEKGFQVFLRRHSGKVEYPDDGTGAAYIVREVCGVESRKDLDTNHKARVLWHQLDRSYMEATGRLAVAR